MRRSLSKILCFVLNAQVIVLKYKWNNYLIKTWKATTDDWESEFSSKI